MDGASTWTDVRARANVLRSVASGGAGFGELARLSGNDPAVVVAAISLQHETPCRGGTVPGEVVLHRLQRLLRAMVVPAVS